MSEHAYWWDIILAAKHAQKYDVGPSANHSIGSLTDLRELPADCPSATVCTLTEADSSGQYRSAQGGVAGQ